MPTVPDLCKRCEVRARARRFASILRAIFSAGRSAHRLFARRVRRSFIRKDPPFDSHTSTSPDAEHARGKTLLINDPAGSATPTRRSTRFSFLRCAQDDGHGEPRATARFCREVGARPSSSRSTARRIGVLASRPPTRGAPSSTADERGRKLAMAGICRRATR